MAQHQRDSRSSQGPNGVQPFRLCCSAKALGRVTSVTIVTDSSEFLSQRTRQILTVSHSVCILKPMSESMTLAELAEASGLPARTIRFYIARRVLSGPGKAGRGAAYGPEHLKRLQQIQRLQSQGRTIAEIGSMVLYGFNHRKTESG